MSSSDSRYESGKRIGVKGVGRGRKRQKAGGGRWSPVGPPRGTAEPCTDTRPASAKIAKGAWGDGVRRVVDHRRPVVEKPLGAAGEKLLFAYHKRAAFKDLVDAGVEIGRAAAEMLGLKKSAASDLSKELDAHGGAYAWFVREALRLIQAGRIPRGRATARSGTADAFYKLLAGGDWAWSELESRLGGMAIIDANAEYHKEQDPALREALDYKMNHWISHGESGETLCLAG